MQKNQQQKPVAPAGDLDHSTEKKTCNDWAGEPLEGSGFEKEIPDPDFEWQE